MRPKLIQAFALLLMAACTALLMDDLNIRQENARLQVTVQIQQQEIQNQATLFDGLGKSYTLQEK